MDKIIFNLFLISFFCSTVHEEAIEIESFHDSIKNTFGIKNIEILLREMA